MSILKIKKFKEISMHNKFKIDELVIVNGIGKENGTIYKNRIAKVICRDPFYFDYNIRNDAQRYGERHESRQVLFRLPNFFDGIYQPWEDCSSAQLLIEVQ